MSPVPPTFFKTMASSSTDIANLALQKIGESRINSIGDENDKNARVCNLNYDQSRLEALMMCGWRFAKKQASLSKLATVPIYKWKAQYQLPSDLLRLTEIQGTDVWAPKEYFDIQEKKLLLYPTDSFDEAADTINIEYIYDVVDVSQFDALFVDVLALKLASMIARPLTGSDTLGQNMTQELTTISLPKAMEINGHQLYTDNNNPINKMMADSMMRKARRATGFSNTGLDA